MNWIPLLFVVGIGDGRNRRSHGVRVPHHANERRNQRRMQTVDADRHQLVLVHGPQFSGCVLHIITGRRMLAILQRMRRSTRISRANIFATLLNDNTTDAYYLVKTRKVRQHNPHFAGKRHPRFLIEKFA